MRAAGQGHGYECEVNLDPSGRWAWKTQLDAMEVASGFARWRWLAKWRAEDAAAFDYLGVKHREAKQQRRRGVRWKPEL